MRTAATNLPQVDYHVHLEGDITLDRALELSAERGVAFGLVEHGGKGQALSDDASLGAYVERLTGRAEHIGMQAEGLDWMECFSTAAVARLDYVLTDALTFPGPDGELIQLWRPEAQVGEAEAFMDRYVDFHLQILATEPIDILANPTFLPRCLTGRYGELWTVERMEGLIEAAVGAGVALEINSRYCVPRAPFIARSKAAGATFAFGSNYHSDEVGKLDYCLRMAREHDLQPVDLFAPRPPGQKPR
ncbi:hypothetical protein ACFL6X_09475 [Candidatus Latescibacterota bacterium]